MGCEGKSENDANNVLRCSKSAFKVVPEVAPVLWYAQRNSL